MARIESRPGSWSDLSGAGTAKVLTGNYAAAYGAKLARVEVVSAFPITPQTSIVEKLAEFVSTGEMPARFVKVESEHSVMAVCCAASIAGARTFTATSSQGLVLMHEMLHWAGRGRMPIVLVNVNRGLGAPWNLGTEQDDSLSQRDTGWLQLYCESNQEVLDTTIQAFRLAETVSLPVMVVLDGFYLSHTAEPVIIPNQESVDMFLPKRETKYRLDSNNPLAILSPGMTMIKLRREIQTAMEEAKGVALQVDQEFEAAFGRSYGLVEGFHLDDAEIALVTSATLTSTARAVVKKLRSEGQKVGILKIRMFRPFPKQEVREALARVGKIAVIDRNLSYGSSGVFATEVKAAMYDAPQRPPIFEFLAGLTGIDVTPKVIEGIIEQVRVQREPDLEPVWADKA